MSCFLPSACLFCKHFDHVAAVPSCVAFDEIPEEIFRGTVEHTTPLREDGGINFELDPEHAEAFHEVQVLRRELEEGLGWTA